MLLRFFVHFYDMEIIEEEAFLAWKEDITQEFPGKGKALFQVNFREICCGFSHLNWYYLNEAFKVKYKQNSPGNITYHDFLTYKVNSSPEENFYNVRGFHSIHQSPGK